MHLRGKDIRSITTTDLFALRDEKVRESRHLDYKQELPGNQNSERKEFLKDVTAMTNAGGGVLLYGITEKRIKEKKTGYPEEIVGVAANVTDDDLRRLENMIRDNSDPPLTRCVAVAIPVSESNAVVGIGVPRSLLAPHAVSIGSRTYWRRGSAGNYPLDTRELRQMFLEGATWDEEVEEYRRTRTAAVRQRIFIPNLDTDGSFFLHVLPRGRLREAADIMPLRDEFSQRAWQTLGVGARSRPNLDGYLVLDNGDPDCKTYVQWLRNGGIEFYSSIYHRRDKPGERLKLAASHMASDAKKALALAVEFFDRLGVEPPFAVLLSVFDTLGCSIIIDELGLEESLSLRIDNNRFDRDPVFIQAVILQDRAQALDEVLLPALDMLWQAAGINESLVRRFKNGW